MDIERYAGKDLKISDPRDAPAAVAQFYADMLGVELTDHDLPATKIEGEDPVKASFAAGLMRQPRTWGSGALEDAKKLREYYTYKDADPQADASHDIPIPFDQEAELKPGREHRSAFFPTSRKPNDSPSGSAASDVKYLHEPARRILTDLVSKDTYNILHYLFPDGFNHFHIQTIR